jgi:riboflavin kinase/FMN adenylyltransferase
MISLLFVFSPEFSTMQIHRNLDQLPPFKKAVITIGTFDGVHTGHQRIISQLREESEKIKGETVIITFDPHPRKVIGPPLKEIRLINTLEEKTELLARKNIDHLVIVPFTEAFSQLTANQYIEKFLIQKFLPHTIIIGWDHRFGKGREGDYRLLEDLKEEFGYILREIPLQVLNSASISSTRIREAIALPDISIANELLGYTFFFEGRVVEGNKLGRNIGYPTANLFIENEEKLLPGDGVYAVEVDWVHDARRNIAQPSASGSPDPRLRGMMNIGVRPTIGGTQRVIEVNIFDFEEAIYGKLLRVYVKKYLRGEQKFANLDMLKEQLAKDKLDTIRSFSGITSSS